MDEEPLLTPQEREALIASLRDEVCNAASSRTNEPIASHLTRVGETLSGYPDETLLALSDHLQMNLKSTGDTPTAATLVIWEMSAEDINECIALLPNDLSHLMLGLGIPTVLRSIHHYPQLPPMKDYSKASLYIRQQAEALINVTLRLDDALDPNFPVTTESKADVPFTLITDDDLVNLIMEFPHEADRIGEIILERHHWDADFLRMMLESNSPALTDGTL